MNKREDTLSVKIKGRFLFKNVKRPCCLLLFMLIKKNIIPQKQTKRKSMFNRVPITAQNSLHRILSLRLKIVQDNSLSPTASLILILISCLITQTLVINRKFRQGNHLQSLPPTQVSHKFSFMVQLAAKACHNRHKPRICLYRC